MTEDWERLGRSIAARRGAMRCTQTELAEAAEVTVKTINNLENGRARGMRATTRSSLEVALGWTEGSIMRVLYGGDASPSGGGLRPWPDPSQVVGGEAHDGSHVADRGPDDRSPGISDTELLDEIRRVRAEVDERFDDLERRLRDRSVEGPR